MGESIGSLVGALVGLIFSGAQSALLAVQRPKDTANDSGNACGTIASFMTAFERAGHTIGHTVGASMQNALVQAARLIVAALQGVGMVVGTLVGACSGLMLGAMLEIRRAGGPDVEQGAMPDIENDISNQVASHEAEGPSRANVEPAEPRCAVTGHQDSAASCSHDDEAPSTSRPFLAALTKDFRERQRSLESIINSYGMQQPAVPEPESEPYTSHDRRAAEVELYGVKERLQRYEAAREALEGGDSTAAQHGEPG